MNQLLLVVALVLQIQNGQPVGSATGFFYEKNSVIYFVTNRHVVFDESGKIKPESLRIRLHTDSNDLTKNEDFEIPLYSNGVPKWHVHPAYPAKKIDIAVIEIDAAKTDKYYFKALSASVFPPRDVVLALSEDIMITGFPRGFSDTTHNLPISRSGMISSAYRIDFQGLPMFLVDANLHPGMSGSPVLTKARGIWPDSQGSQRVYKEPAAFLLGVFSSTINFNPPGGQQEALGLGVVWYGYLIDEIIDSFAKKSITPSRQSSVLPEKRASMLFY
jgi:hypothetical protein